MIANGQGRWMRGDILDLIGAMELGARTVVTPVSSNTALEARRLFSHAVHTRIGSPYVIAAIESDSAEPGVGHEANGGFLLGRDVSLSGGKGEELKIRDAILPTTGNLSAACRMEVRISDLRSRLPGRYTASGRLQHVDLQACRRLLERLADDGAARTARLAPIPDQS